MTHCKAPKIVVFPSINNPMIYFRRLAARPCIPNACFAGNQCTQPPCMLSAGSPDSFERDNISSGHEKATAIIYKLLLLFALVRGHSSCCMHPRSPIRVLLRVIHAAELICHDLFPCFLAVPRGYAQLQLKTNSLGLLLNKMACCIVHYCPVHAD